MSSTPKNGLKPTFACLLMCMILTSSCRYDDNDLPCLAKSIRSNGSTYDYFYDNQNRLERMDRHGTFNGAISNSSFHYFYTPNGQIDVLRQSEIMGDVFQTTQYYYAPNGELDSFVVFNHDSKVHYRHTYLNAGNGKIELLSYKNTGELRYKIVYSNCVDGVYTRQEWYDYIDGKASLKETTELTYGQLKNPLSQHMAAYIPGICNMVSDKNLTSFTQTGPSGEKFVEILYTYHYIENYPTSYASKLVRGGFPTDTTFDNYRIEYMCDEIPSN